MKLKFCDMLLMMFIYFYLSECDAKELYDVFLSNVMCNDADPTVTYNFTCITRAINRTTKTNNVTIAIAPNVSLNEIYVKISLYQKSNAGYRRVIIDAEENFCGFVDGTSKSLLIAMLWGPIKRHSNIGHPCPYTGIVTVRDLIVSDEFFPPYLPEGQFKLNIHIRNGADRISSLRLTAFGEIKPKGALKLDF